MTSKIGWEMSVHETQATYPLQPLSPVNPQLPPPYYGVPPTPLYSPQSPLYHQNTCYNNYPQMQLPYAPSETHTGTPTVPPVPPARPLPPSPPPPYSPSGIPPLQPFHQQPSSLQYYGGNYQHQTSINSFQSYQENVYQPYQPSAPPSAPSSISGADERRENLVRAPSLGFEEIDNPKPNTGNLYPSLSRDHKTKEAHPTYQQFQEHPPTPLPPKSILLWESSAPVKIFFIQQEGHVVSPSQSVSFLAYKCPPMHDVSSFPAGSLAGGALNATLLLKAEETWRLGLAKERSHIVRGLQGEFAFYDNSTSPARFVIVVLSREETKEGRQRLDVLLMGSSSLIDEPANIVDKLESGVESVFGTLTSSVTNAVKKGTPELHKNTKWLRKGTGQVVRFGGSLVSKGVHLVSDNVMDKDVPKTASSQHKVLFEALKTYRDAFENKKITYIEQIH